MMRSVIGAVVAVVLLGSVPAHAHKVIASVFASGDVIEGEIGFSNGDMAVDALVEVFDADGNKLGEVRTDADGFFTYAPTARVEHVFKANLGAGHVAEFRMAADGLPAIASTASADPAPAGTGGLTDAQRDLVAEAVRREIKPLRREIAAYKERNDFQSILGGIGYILGLFGLGFYLAARRRASS